MNDDATHARMSGSCAPMKTLIVLKDAQNGVPKQLGSEHMGRKIKQGT
jgi:hypothetical protein